VIFISLACTTLVQWVLFRERKLSDACWVIFLIFLYYAYFVPVSISLTGQYDIWLVNQPVWVSDGDLLLTAEVNALGFIGFAFGYWLLTRGSSHKEYIRQSRIMELLARFTSIRIVIIAIFVCACLIAIVYRDEFMRVLEGYDVKVEVNYENSGYSYVIGLLFFLTSISINYLSLESLNGRAIAVGGAVLFVLASFVVFSKQPFIFAFLAVLCFLSRGSQVSPFRITMLLASGAVIALVYLVPIFAGYRVTGTIDLTTGTTASAATISSDALGPYGVTVYAFNGYVRAQDHPFWQSFFLWVPRALWPGRPLDLAEEFARQMIVGWQPGFGLAFSPLAEAYTRLGAAGVAPFMALCGATIGGFQWLAVRMVPSDARPAVGLTFASVLSLAALRSPYSAIITQGMQGCVPLVLIGLVARQMSWIETTRSARSADAPPKTLG